MMVHLGERGVIEVAGEDRVAFLQGLVSNDVTQAVQGMTVWAALLTPQGKYLADFFIIAYGEILLLDCEREQAAMLIKLLSRYRLRAKVTLRDRSDELHVHAAWDRAPEGDIVVADPRHKLAGWRVISSAILPDTATEAAYHTHRICLGLPDGTRDMEVEKSVLLEAGFDEFGGVSWTKGCYMGQELTARTKYRGLLKRKLVPVRLVGEMPAPGTPVMRGDDEVGVIRSGAGDVAMALLRIDAIGGDLLAAGTKVSAL
jgi:folate-binding protein YgfZ